MFILTAEFVSVLSYSSNGLANLLMIYSFQSLFLYFVVHNIFVIIRNLSSWSHLSLAAIGKNRPVYYERALQVLFGFDPSLDTSKGAHSASLRYSLKTAFLGFLRSPCQEMIQVGSPYLATSSLYHFEG